MGQQGGGVGRGHQAQAVVSRGACTLVASLPGWPTAAQQVNRRYLLQGGPALRVRCRGAAAPPAPALHAPPPALFEGQGEVLDAAVHNARVKLGDLGEPGAPHCRLAGSWATAGGREGKGDDRWDGLLCRSWPPCLKSARCVSACCWTRRSVCGLQWRAGPMPAEMCSSTHTHRPGRPPAGAGWQGRQLKRSCGSARSAGGPARSAPPTQVHQVSVKVDKGPAGQPTHGPHAEQKAHSILVHGAAPAAAGAEGGGAASTCKVGWGCRLVARSAAGRAQQRVCAWMGKPATGKLR